MNIAVYHNLAAGGAKRVVAEQVRRLAAAHSVTVFVPETADTSFAEPSAVAPVRRYPFVPAAGAPSPFGRINPAVRLWNARRLDRLGRTVARDVAVSGADVLLVHPCQSTQAPAVLRHATVPTVYFCHEIARRAHGERFRAAIGPRERFRRALDAMDPIHHGELAVLRALDSWYARAATAIACNSRQTAADIERLYHRTPTVCRLAPPSGVPVVTGRTRDRFVLSVGALAPHKGFDLLVRAIATIRPDVRPTLVVACNYEQPDERERLEAMAGSLGVDATFRCALTDDELGELYATAGCFAYAPLREPFGLVVLEAMRAGLPVVAVAEGGMLESVDPEVTGLLAPRDPVAFGRAILRVLDDERTARTLACQARRAVADQWTWDRHQACLARTLEMAVAHA